MTDTHVARNHQVRVRGLLNGAPAPSDFEMVEADLPAPRRGEMLCRTQWISLDPHVRTHREGELLPARAICEVIDSRNEVFNNGELVVLDAGAQSYCLSGGVNVQRLRTGGAPKTTALGVLGIPGLMAYYGLLHLAGVHQGETVLVSAAADPIGSMVGQIARIKGCRVIGIVNSPDKATWCLRQAHFAACIDLSAETLEARLHRLAPRGVDVYFDNVGGELLEAVVTHHLAPQGRVVLASAAAINGSESAGERLMTLIQSAIESRREAFLRDAFAWFAEGHLRYHEDIVEGLHNAPAHFCQRARGETLGEALVKA